MTGWVIFGLRTNSSIPRNSRCCGKSYRRFCSHAARTRLVTWNISWVWTSCVSDELCNYQVLYSSIRHSQKSNAAWYVYTHEERILREHRVITPALLVSGDVVWKQEVAYLACAISISPLILWYRRVEELEISNTRVNKRSWCQVRSGRPSEEFER